MSILSGWILTGCHSAAAPSPDALFLSVYSDYLHGKLDTARARAARARLELSTPGPKQAVQWALKFRLLEADVLVKQGRLAEVLALLTAADMPFPARGDLAIKRNLLCALAHSRLGQSEESQRELLTARQLAEATHSSLMADVLRTEGVLALDADKFVAATEKFKSSLAVAHEGGDVIVQAANRVDIGFVQMTTGHFAEALTWFQEAARFAHAAQALRQLEIATGNIGWCYQNLGDFERALVHFQAAERQAEAIGLANDRLVWLQNAGLAEYRLGNLESARTYDEQALRLALSLPAKKVVDQVANIETNLALLLYEQGRDPQAKSYSDAAVVAARNSNDQTVIAYAELTQGLLVARLTGDPQAAAILLSAWQRVPDLDVRADIETAIANLYSREKQSEEAQRWYRRAIQTFEDKRSAVMNAALRLSTFSYGAAVYRDYATFLIEANKPVEALQVLDRSRARTLEEGLTNSDSKPHVQDKPVAEPAAVARKLQASILFYSLGPQQSYLWAVSGHEVKWFPLPREQEIRSLVTKHQADIQQSADPLRNPNAAAASLFDVLIKPAAAMIPAGSRVFIIPDGVLHSLNFETLAASGAEGRRYWIEDATVTTASSIRMLAESRTDTLRARGKDLLLIGDPYPPQADFAALPEAAVEIQQVSQHFPLGSQLVVARAEAIPAAYATSKPDQFRYIHFAAHGTASRLSPLDSAIILSPPQQEPQGFKLYARDIVQYPLNATLVTISACYGSGIRTYAGEGLVGLAWVFLRAGSHNVIAALWQVADPASPLLMGRLYDELQAGKAPDAALRAAKLSLIHSTSVYRKPLFWGAFQIYAGS